MKILEIRPKGVYVVFEIELSQVKKVLKALDMTEIKFDGKKEDEKEAVQYLTGPFYAGFDEVVKGISDEP